MDREERLQALNEIEGQLSQYLAADKKNWIQTYLLMSEVQDKELYVVNYRSYTKWVNHLADSLSIHVSTLWARLKAGKNYAEYASRAREQGRIVPQIEEIDVSPKQEKRQEDLLQPVNLIAYNRKIERRWKKKSLLQILS